MASLRAERNSPAVPKRLLQSGSRAFAMTLSIASSASIRRLSGMGSGFLLRAVTILTCSERGLSPMSVSCHGSVPKIS